jgi:hypothetical protein
MTGRIRRTLSSSGAVVALLTTACASEHRSHPAAPATEVATDGGRTLESIYEVTMHLPPPAGCAVFDAGALAECPPAAVDDRDAPAVVFFERNPWLGLVGSDFPTIALWPDGRVVFVHEEGEKLEARQGRIDAAEAARVTSEVGAGMRGMQRYCDATVGTDAVTVELLARDGAVWRDVQVYGAPRKECSPAGFPELCAKVLALRPAQGTPFVPVDYRVFVWGFEDAAKAVPWPPDIPAPPAQFTPRETAPGDPGYDSYVVDVKYRDAMTRLMTAVADGHTGVGFNGHKWTVYPVPRYRGQNAIDRIVSDCGGVISDHVPH